MWEAKKYVLTLSEHPMSIIPNPVELLGFNFILSNRYFWVNKEPVSENACLATLVHNLWHRICGCTALRHKERSTWKTTSACDRIISQQSNLRLPYSNG